MKEVRFCENCKKWFPLDKMERVSVGSEYHPRYSGINAHTTHEIVYMCGECVRSIFENQEQK